MSNGIDRAALPSIQQSAASEAVILGDDREITEAEFQALARAIHGLE